MCEITFCAIRSVKKVNPTLFRPALAIVRDVSFDRMSTGQNPFFSKYSGKVVMILRVIMNKCEFAGLAGR